MMPYLELSTLLLIQNELRRRIDPFTYLHAVMIYPTDKTCRDRDELRGALEERRAGRSLAVGQTYAVRRAEKLEIGGQIAGELLDTMLASPVVVDGKPVEISYQKAEALLERHLAVVNSKRGGSSKIPSADRTIAKAWGQFRTVAHFWTARRILGMGDGAEPTFGRFLATAETLAERATRMRVFKDVDLWRCPPDVLPRLPAAAPLEWKPPSEKVVQWLRSYRNTNTEDRRKGRGKPSLPL